VSLDVSTWRGFEAFASLGSDWDRLVREAGLDGLCNAHAWCESYARAWSRDEELFGWRFEDRGETVAILAFRREPSRGTLALRRALFAADGSFDSDYLDVPVRPGMEERVVEELLARGREVPWLEALVLSGLPDGSRFLAALRAVLPRRGLTPREHTIACLAAPLGDGFEGYVARLKPRMRSKVRSAMRSAAERGARLVWCQRSDELEAWLEELYRLHELRWRAQGQEGSFAEPRRRAFYASWSRQALARGELCFARLEEPRGVSAIQIGARTGDRYYQIQEGYDPALENERVGTALRGMAVQDLIARGLRSYDFMAGDSRHKRDWGGLPRPCTTIAFPLPRWRARLAYGLRARVERWRRGQLASPAPNGD
jgi:CelD/BcsL family acetyltransferase involved in cellulose biosynthesis